MELGIGGKAYLVTGATRGIGLATARTLLDEGARVAGVARTRESIEAAAELLQGADGVRFIEADLSTENGAAHAVGAAVEAFGELEGVVNNAAAFSVDKDHPDRRAWSGLFELKLLGYEAVIQASLPHLADGGAVVSVSGAASMRYWPGSPHVTAINTGVEALSRHYAAEQARRRIRFNTVVPGVTETDRYRSRVQRLVERGMAQDDARGRVDASIPFGRPVRPSEIAATIAFLLSEHSRSTTGATIPVDGATAVAR